MRSRSFVAVALAIVLLLAGAGAVLAYDSSQSRTIGTVSSQTGIAVDSAALSGRIEAVLSGAASSRRISVPVARIEPKMTTRQLAARNATIITVDRASFRLRLWKNLRLVRTYPIA